MILILCATFVLRFTKMPGKYNLVRTDPYYDKQVVKKVEFDFTSSKPSKLSSGTQELLKTLVKHCFLFFSPSTLSSSLETIFAE